jgi:hypothetical protein
MSFDHDPFPRRDADDDESARRRKIKLAQIKEASRERRAASKAQTAKRKKVKRRLSQLKRRQQQSRKMIIEFGPASSSPNSAPSVHFRPVQGRPAPGPADSGTSVEDLASPCRDSPSVIRWRDAGDLAQLLFACRAVESLGGSHAYHFTVMLSMDFQRRAAENPDWLRRRFAQHVGHHVPMVMVCGYSEGQQLHVHAAISCRGAPGTDHNEELGRIVTALQAAGGDCGAAAAHQVMPTQIYYADGLSKYFHDNAAEAKPVVGGVWWSMTNPARREAKRLYDDIRERINRRSRPAASTNKPKET